MIYFVDDPDRIDIVALGRETRNHPLFAPGGTNANFVSVTGPGALKIRTYERGVENETLACGTGAIASAIVAAALGKGTPPFSLATRGGMRLGVDFQRSGGGFTEISLEGDARIVYKGTIEPEALR